MTAKDAQASLTTRVDNNFNRTAIVMQKDNITSLDILCDDGKTLFCRINLTEFDLDNSGCVDVIIADNQTARMTAYANGNRTQHPTVEGSRVHAIIIYQKSNQ